MSDPNSPATRQRSLARLLDYSLNEARDLGLDDVAQFLAHALASLEKKPRHGAAKKRRKKPSGESVVDLAEFRGREHRPVRRPPSRSTQK